MKKWYSSSCGKIELELTVEDAKSGAHAGQCDDDIAALAQVPYVAAQLDTITPETAKAVATEAGRNDYGHGPEDMNDHQANLHFILWDACWMIVED